MCIIIIRTPVKTYNFYFIRLVLYVRQSNFHFFYLFIILRIRYRKSPPVYSEFKIENHFLINVPRDFVRVSIVLTMRVIRITSARIFNHNRSTRSTSVIIHDFSWRTTQLLLYIVREGDFDNCHNRIVITETTKHRCKVKESIIGFVRCLIRYIHINNVINVLLCSIN